MIHIIGLGPGAPGQITLETMALLENDSTNYFRTSIHPVTESLKAQGISWESFDTLYETCDTFEAVYQGIADALIKKAAELGDIVYAVPGNPVFAEDSVAFLTKRCDAEKIPYRLYAGVSFLDTSMVALNEDPVGGFKLMDAFEVGKQAPDKSMGNLITQVYNRHMASEVKLALMDYYDDEFLVYLLIGAGIPGEERVEKLPLCEIDRVEGINHLTSLYLPPDKGSLRSYTKLLEIMDFLRSKEGCPWDRAQTRETLKPYLLEETYEVIDAIEQDDVDNLIEELGDLLFQIAFHAQLGKEEGLFTINDILEGVNQKMVNRHPHVFRTPEEITAEAVVTNWDEIKKDEKNTTTIYEEMENIPKAFTALMEAYKVQKKAAKIGFDWEKPEEALEKVKEEVLEVEEALTVGEVEHLIEELGDLLFAAVNVVRLSGFQPELVLRKATQKFISRFKKVEEITLVEQKSINMDQLEWLNTLWDSVKTLKTQ